MRIDAIAKEFIVEDHLSKTPLDSDNPEKLSHLYSCSDITDLATALGFTRQKPGLKVALASDEHDVSKWIGMTIAWLFERSYNATK